MITPEREDPGVVMTVLPELLGALRTYRLVRQAKRRHGRLQDTAAGRAILALSPLDQVVQVRAMLAWTDRGRRLGSRRRPNPVWYDNLRSTILQLLGLGLPLQHDDVVRVLDWMVKHDLAEDIPIAEAVVKRFLADRSASSAIRASALSLSRTVVETSDDIRFRQHAVSLRQLVGAIEGTDVLTSGEAWCDAANAEIHALGAADRERWEVLLRHCFLAQDHAPTERWLKTARAAVETIGEDAFRSACLRWFPLIATEGTDGAWRLGGTSVTILRSLVWLCDRPDDPELARALADLAIEAYRCQPTSFEPRSRRLGHACVATLGRMPGREGALQLSVLASRLKNPSERKAVDAAFALAANRAGLDREDIVELAVPTFGLDETGRRTLTLGDHEAKLVVEDGAAALVWRRINGRRLAGVPAAIKSRHVHELAQLKQDLSDLRKTLSAQRDRIEGLYLTQRQWEFDAWRERYLDQPVVGTLARRLVWKFSQGDRASSGIWHEGQIVGLQSEPIDWLGTGVRVELWHPLNVAPALVLAWREWLRDHELRQPFKQAHREVYLLTDAERVTRNYSNRFAAHILRQSQFVALCRARDWSGQQRSLTGGGVRPAHRELPAWGLRAEYWTDAVGDTLGVDTDATGVFHYVSTDQVRFYRADAPDNRSAGPGGAFRSARPSRASTPLPLDRIPERVFSEIMRDVDLFVGVASLGNDPHWADGGPEGRHADYWQSYAFGDLSQVADTRREVIEALLPRLAIASRCHLNGRFLIVEGDLRSYKIHLGSSNILMSPNDQYLCIVPGQQKGPSSSDRFFLPFEGDRTLALVLSKAFLLADDTRITDPTITRQIRRDG